MSPKQISRKAWGYILFYGAMLSLVAAFGLDRLGWRGESFGPLPFVSAVVCLKLGLFAFWPIISKKGREASTVISEVFPSASRQDLTAKDAKGAKVEQGETKRLSLWSDGDGRIDNALFQSNVPTFVLNHEQRFLDWNAAFDLVFSGATNVRRGAHVSAWFEHLDNFKRVSKRQEKLFGEGILPITDRERATYVSPDYGRMVFTKIMTPIVDRMSGRILGWTVVLNVNSVGKREEFFERLYATLARETRKVRHAAAIDGLFKRYSAHRELLAVHMRQLVGKKRVLELGAGAGLLTKKLLASGAKVTVVEAETELLRKLRDRCAEDAANLRCVRRDFGGLEDLPAERFDAVSLSFSTHRFADLGTTLKDAFKTLRSGGTLVLSGLVPANAAGKPVSVETLFDHLRQGLESAGAYDEQKHQMNHVFERELELASEAAFAPRSLATLAELCRDAGFDVELAQDGHLGGNAALLLAKKP